MFKLKLLKNMLIGISWGCTVFVFMGLITFIIAPEVEPIGGNEFVKQAFASMITGIGFSVPSMIYDNERLSNGLKVLFHMGIGFLVYTPTAIYVGWLPTTYGTNVFIISTLIAVFISFIVWSGFYLYDKYQSKLINDRILDRDK